MRDPPLKDRKLRANTIRVARLRLVAPFWLNSCLTPATGLSTLYRSSIMHLEYLRKHIDALMALSHDVKDRAASARLRELADECRIMLSLADVSEMVAAVIKNSEVNPSDE